jgi:hypothetical protein
MITIKVQATGALLTDPGVLDRFDAEVASTIAELGALGQRLVVTAAPRGVSAGGGGLRGSIFTELRGQPARRQAIVASSVFYAPVVEAGRRPGARRPPLEPIRLWVIRKLGISSLQARQVAFLVARAIGRRGTKGQHMFERAAQQLLPIAASRFQALEERIVRILRGD